MAYGYYPCGREGNSLVVLDPEQPQNEVGRFDLPRQRSGNRYCIADFYRDAASGASDVLPMQAVTMGERATAFAQELFKGDQYSDYLYFHGLGVQMAEALRNGSTPASAVNWLPRSGGHAPTGCAGPALWGSRYSVGYPACPNVPDSRQQLRWLGSERIGLSMDESDQLEPEQSTTALVALHSQARYFSA